MKHISLKFSALLFPYFTMWAIGPGFFVVVLEQKGIAANETAIYTCIISVVAAVVQPLMGFLCDKTGKAKTIISLSMILSTAAYIWLYFLEGTVSLVLCSVLIGATMNAMYGFSESWLSKLDCKKLGINFGAVRAVGSFSYAVAAGVYGRVFDAFGAASLPVAMVISTAILVPAAMICPNPQISERQKQDGQLADAFGELMKNRRFVLFIICYFLAVIPTGAASSYYAIHIRQLGGTAGDVGLALFILAGAEIIFMPMYKKLEELFGTEKLLVFAFFMYAVKNLAIGLSGNVTLAIFASAINGLCFPFTLAGAQSYVDRITPRKYAATAQLISNTCGMIISQIVGLALCGVLTTFITAGAALALLSIFAFASCAIFTVGIKKLNNN